MKGMGTTPRSESHSSCDDTQNFALFPNNKTVKNAFLIFSKVLHVFIAIDRAIDGDIVLMKAFDSNNANSNKQSFSRVSPCRAACHPFTVLASD